MVWQEVSPSLLGMILWSAACVCLAGEILRRFQMKPPCLWAQHELLYLVVTGFTCSDFSEFACYFYIHIHFWYVFLFATGSLREKSLFLSSKAVRKRALATQCQIQWPIFELLVTITWWVSGCSFKVYGSTFFKSIENCLVRTQERWWGSLSLAASRYLCVKPPACLWSSRVSITSWERLHLQKAVFPRGEKAYHSFHFALEWRGPGRRGCHISRVPHLSCPVLPLTVVPVRSINPVVSAFLLFLSDGNL